MQAWTVPPLKPPAEIRLEDNLQRKGLVAPPAPRRDGVPSATVEVIGRVEGEEEQLQAFRDWFRKDLQLAFLAPPPRLGRVELGIFMANPTDPIKAVRDSVLFTRGWYQAPLQADAQERARVEALYK